MVGKFMRSLSFPNKKPPISHHLRSISLPSRPHPLISHLRRQIDELHLWSSQQPGGTTTRTSTWLCDGLARLKDVHDYLDDIIQLPQTRESLCRRHPGWIENLLEDFLHFADAYGSFQNVMFGMRELHLSAHVAVRKRDDVKVAVFLKSRRKLCAEMAKLVNAIRTRSGWEYARVVVAPEDAELAGILREIVEVTVLVSTVVFGGFSTRKTASSWMGGLRKRARRSAAKIVEVGIEEMRGLGGECLLGLKRKSDEEVRTVMRRVQAMEACICEVEKGGERMFRRDVKRARRSAAKIVEVGIEEMRGLGGECLLGLKRKSEGEVRTVMRRVQAMEACICEVEKAGERMFRSLISTRVSLLNCLAL
ncbi:unnamed protein product [Linum tenue]|uniref:Uncharacterized protein n=1 Tax=Linum tenue TaxID=586396 RepID=A0AAV0LL24_9ROSI|nr:unnamed protein product [Linum tenue]